MSCRVEFQILRNPALSGDMFQTGVRGFQGSDREDLSRILGKEPVESVGRNTILFKNSFRNRK